MAKYFLGVPVLLLTLNVSAFELESAYRSPHRSYEEYETRALQQATLDPRDGEIINAESSRRLSALREAKLYDPDVLPGATKWRADQLQRRFELIRDQRVIAESESESSQRRLSWMYPDDGCFARAALANRILFHDFVPVPKKVFAFGRLRASTSNSRRGFVTWWYHVAPVVEVKGEKFVLDPAIEASAPLPLQDWLGRMGKPEKIKVSICESGTYSPGDSCNKETDGLEKRAEATQRNYLRKERLRLKSLGRSSELELGENPPWLTKIR